LNSDNIRVDPHITQYTVYITDNYTGNSIVNVNVTKIQFTFNAPENGLCPMYQVSAWNVGGEGELSEMVQEHSKLPIYSPYMEEYYFTCLFYFLSSSEDSNWKCCYIHNSISSFAHSFTSKLDLNILAVGNFVILKVIHICR